MAYTNLNYIFRDKIDEIRKVCKVYKDISKYHDVEIKEIFKDYDYLIEISDYETIINNSVLKNELEKIEKLKIMFTQINDSMLREKGFAEIDELEETSDREILNRNMCLDLRRRRLNFTNQDNIYYKNKEDESYNEIKSFFLDLCLPWDLNHDFEQIANRLKVSVASKKQSFTFFRAIYHVSDDKQKYVIVIPELKFNNERFGKDIYKLFIPYTSLVMCEIIQVNVENSNSWSKSGYPLLKARNSKVIELSRVRSY